MFVSGPQIVRVGVTLPLPVTGIVRTAPAKKSGL
jgi:hypothetical protein